MCLCRGDVFSAACCSRKKGSQDYLCRIQFGLRRPADAAKDRRNAARTAVALCCGQARWRVLLSGLYARLRLETLTLAISTSSARARIPVHRIQVLYPGSSVRSLPNQRPVIYGDGEQSRDFTYIDNVVSANLKAAETARALAR